MSSVVGPIVNHSKGKGCAILGCRENPTMQCPKCLKHYCYPHSKGHFHQMSGTEKREWANDRESLR